MPREDWHRTQGTEEHENEPIFVPKLLLGIAFVLAII
jgi:hypothetical protein